MEVALSRISTFAGMVAGGLLFVGATLAGMAAHPGATLRSIQAQMIDGGLGAPDRLGTGDAELYTWHYGPEDAPLVVLVHGFGDSGAGWTQVAQSLGKDHHVMVLDLPGHGRSGPRTAPLTFDLLKAGLERAIGEESGVTLVGNSLGGWLAADYTEAHPDRVDRLILVNNAGLKTDISTDLLLPKTRTAMRRKNEAVMGRTAPDMPDIILDGLLELHQDPRLAALFDTLQTSAPHLDDRLATIAPKTRLVWGTPDPFFPVEGYLERMQQLTGQEPVFIDGCGHAPQYGCPEETASAIRDALP